jgi:hypothetical protein
MCSQNCFNFMKSRIKENRHNLIRFYSFKHHLLSHNEERNFILKIEIHYLYEHLLI